VTVYGFSTSVELSQFTASYSAVTTTGSRYRLPPTTTYKDDNGNQYVAYGQPPPASEATVQFVITPGFQLGFEPNPQNSTIDAGILARTEALMKTPTCKDFLNRLLAELGKATGRGRAGTSFEDLFNAARGSIFSSPNLKDERGDAGTKLIGYPGLAISILIRPTVPTDKQSAPTTIMHEIIHDAPGAGLQYNHTYMARAAFAVADAMGMTKDHDYPLQLGQQTKPFEGTNEQKTAADNWNSSLFQQILVHACR